MTAFPLALFVIGSRLLEEGSAAIPDGLISCGH